MGDDSLIIVLSALAAAASFVAFAYPFLKQTEKKEHFRSVIEKRRKDLRDAARSTTASRAKEQTVSAAESMAGFYKVQQIAGQMGEDVRSKLLQAGIRSPAAPIKFMIARGVVPIFLCLFSMMIMSGMEEPPQPVSKLLVLGGMAFAGFKLPDILVKNQVLKRQEEINLTFPDALDMMLICVQGGIGLEQTIERVALEVSESSPILAEELGILGAEMAMLNDRRQALQDFARRVGSGAGKTFATTVIQAEQYGTSVSQALRVMSDELRDMRMAAAEQKAAALPPKLTVPMILFFLPALFVVILGPAGIQAANSGVGG